LHFFAPPQYRAMERMCDLLRVSSWGAAGRSVLPHFFTYAIVAPLAAPVSLEVPRTLHLLA